MILARVVGTAVSTIKHDCYYGTKVLVCEVLNPLDGSCTTQTSFLAVDSVQAGVGDVVVVAREGNAARQVLGTQADPFHSVILGIVDSVDVGHGGPGNA